MTPPVLLDAIEELRDAGAEAIQVNNVRIVASSHFSQGASGIAIDGKNVTQPYTISASATQRRCPQRCRSQAVWLRTSGSSVQPSTSPRRKS